MTHHPDKSTENADKSTENADKSTENADKSTEKAESYKTLIIKIFGAGILNWQEKEVRCLP